MIHVGQFYTLRNGMKAFVTEGTERSAFFGVVTPGGLNCSWDVNGAYMDNGKPHPLDIVLTDAATSDNDK